MIASSVSSGLAIFFCAPIHYYIYVCQVVEGFSSHRAGLENAFRLLTNIYDWAG